MDTAYVKNPGGVMLIRRIRTEKEGRVRPNYRPITGTDNTGPVIETRVRLPDLISRPAADIIQLFKKF